MKHWISILSLFVLLASPAIYAAESVVDKNTATEISVDGNKNKGDGEAEPDCE